MFEEIIANNFTSLIKIISSDLRIIMNSNTISVKKTIPKHVIKDFLKTSNKEKI